MRAQSFDRKFKKPTKDPVSEGPVEPDAQLWGGVIFNPKVAITIHNQ